jgi:hypothetical protein
MPPEDVSARRVKKEKGQGCYKRITDGESNGFGNELEKMR